MNPFKALVDLFRDPSFYRPSEVPEDIMVEYWHIVIDPDIPTGIRYQVGSAKITEIDPTILRRVPVACSAQNPLVLFKLTFLDKRKDAARLCAKDTFLSEFGIIPEKAKEEVGEWMDALRELYVQEIRSLEELLEAIRQL